MMEKTFKKGFCPECHRDLSNGESHMLECKYFRLPYNFSQSMPGSLLGYCHIHRIGFEIEKFGGDCPECRKERSILKYSGAVKVMRSYDYCHFEIQLASSDSKTIGEIDEMRKEAARLADKAVKQYAIAKEILSSGK